jgi:hypothetical protein
MSEDWKSCRVLITTATCDGHQLGEAIVQLKPKYLLQYSDLAIEFRAAGEALEKLSLQPEGRAFSDSVEVRWYQFSETEYARTRIEEAADGSACEYRDKKYYLWGRWLAREQRFHDPAVPAELAYPLPNGEVPKNGERPYILVREYRRAMPTNPSASRLAEFVDALNQPPIWAHRFVSYHVSPDGLAGGAAKREAFVEEDGDASV